MRNLTLNFLTFNNHRISFKSLDKGDRNRVRKNENLLHNKNFITSRILKNRIKKRQFCLSHKDGFCAILSGAKEIGIDIERLKDRNFQAIIDFCFLDNEREFLDKSLNFKVDFYKVFTTKEAIIKAKNLSFCDLDKVSFFDRNFIKTHLLKGDFIISAVINKRRIK